MSPFPSICVSAVEYRTLLPRYASNRHLRGDHFAHLLIRYSFLDRVFEYAHKQEIKKVRDEGTWGAAQLETIIHPNEYFKRSYLLKNLGRNPKTEGDSVEADVKMED